MNRYRCLAVAMLTGIVLGATAATLYYRHRLQTAPPQWLYVYFTGQAIKDVNALTQFRRGETNDAINDLEEDLSMQIHDLLQHFPEEALSERDSIRILKAAARYRSEHPFRTGNSERDRTVEEALARARTKE